MNLNTVNPSNWSYSFNFNVFFTSLILKETLLYFHEIDLDLLSNKIINISKITSFDHLIECSHARRK